MRQQRPDTNRLDFKSRDVKDKVTLHGEMWKYKA